MELLERAVLPWMQRCERISGQGKAARGGDAWPQRTGARERLRTASRDPTMFTRCSIRPSFTPIDPPLNYLSGGRVYSLILG